MKKASRRSAKEQHSAARGPPLQAGCALMSRMNQMNLEARSQGVVVVGSIAEELDQGPERRLDGREAIM